MTFNRSRAEARPGRRRFSGRKPSASPNPAQPPRAPHTQHASHAQPRTAQPTPREPRPLSPELAARIPLSPFTELGLDKELVGAVLAEGADQEAAEGVDALVEIEGDRR